MGDTTAFRAFGMQQQQNCRITEYLLFRQHTKWRLVWVERKCCSSYFIAHRSKSQIWMCTALYVCVLRVSVFAYCAGKSVEHQSQTNSLPWHASHALFKYHQLRKHTIYIFIYHVHIICRNKMCSTTQTYSVCVCRMSYVGCSTSVQ